MCLAVPGRILRIVNDGLFNMADVDFCGVVRSVCIDTVDAEPGDYVVAHAGVAISVMDVNEARAAIVDLQKMADARERTSDSDGGTS